MFNLRVLLLTSILLLISSISYALRSGDTISTIKTDTVIIVDEVKLNNETRMTVSVIDTSNKNSALNRGNFGHDIELYNLRNQEVSIGIIAFEIFLLPRVAK